MSDSPIDEAREMGCEFREPHPGLHAWVYDGQVPVTFDGMMVYWFSREEAAENFLEQMKESDDEDDDNSGNSSPDDVSSGDGGD